MKQGIQGLLATLKWLKEKGQDVAAINSEPMLYVAIAAALGKPFAPGLLPESRKLAARAIRHYARTGELVAIPLTSPAPARMKFDRRKIRERLADCFEVGDVGESRPGLLQRALEAQRPTRITLLFEEQNGRCYYCSEPMMLSKAALQQKRFATLDHVRPKSKGGIRSADNSVAACAECNFLKGSMARDEFVTLRENNRMAEPCLIDQGGTSSGAKRKTN